MNTVRFTVTGKNADGLRAAADAKLREFLPEGVDAKVFLAAQPCLQTAGGTTALWEADVMAEWWSPKRRPDNEGSA